MSAYVAATRLSRNKSRSKMGKAKAAVLPEPVAKYHTAQADVRGVQTRTHAFGQVQQLI